MKKKMIQTLVALPFALAAFAFTTQANAQETVDMHRLYNPNSGEHFYTANTAEKDHLVKVGWKYEGLVVIDYLQLIEGSNKESRQQEVSEISRQLKKLAKELGVPILALSQLSRGVEQRQDKRPVLSDIRESGSIEQDADIVAFLYRDDYYERGESKSDDDEDDEPLNQDVGEVELIIEKNRAGARGTVKLLFIKSYNKFSNISYAQEPPM